MQLVQKIHFTIVLQSQVVYNLFLTVHQILGSCSYKIVVMKKSVILKGLKDSCNVGIVTACGFLLKN